MSGSGNWKSVGGAGLSSRPVTLRAVGERFWPSALVREERGERLEGLESVRVDCPDARDS